MAQEPPYLRGSGKARKGSGGYTPLRCPAPKRQEQKACISPNALLRIAKEVKQVRANLGRLRQNKGSEALKKALPREPSSCALLKSLCSAAQQGECRSGPFKRCTRVQGGERALCNAAKKRKPCCILTRR